MFKVDILAIARQRINNGTAPLNPIRIALPKEVPMAAPIIPANLESTEEGSQVLSTPPPGMCRVTNIYVDPNSGKLVIKYDETPVP